MLEHGKFLETRAQLPEMAIARFKVVSKEALTSSEDLDWRSRLSPPSWFDRVADSTPRMKIITDSYDSQGGFEAWDEEESKNRGHWVRSVSLLETEEQGYEVPVSTCHEVTPLASLSPYEYEVDAVLEEYISGKLKLTPHIFTKCVDPLSADKDLDAFMKWLQSIRPVCAQQSMAKDTLAWLRLDLKRCKDPRDQAALAAVIKAFENFEWKPDEGQIPPTTARDSRGRL